MGLGHVAEADERLSTTGHDSYGSLLRAHRHRARLTLEELAEASGVSARAISDMERGRSRTPQRRTVIAVAEALRLPPADHRAMLAAARARRLPSTAASPPAGLCELPRSVADFTGRGAELDWVAALADASGDGRAGAATVALVSGPAGLGKTALAVHAAHVLGARFPDGALFLDLRGMDPEPVPGAVALGRLVRALGTAESAVPADPQDLAGLYRTLLRQHRVLVVLDNAADEAQVRPLLPAGGRSLTLVTSRRLLAGLESVRRLNLGSLSPAAAGELLSAIVGPDRQAAGTAAIEEVTRLCGCLPLALRIAGNRLLSRPAWTPGDLAGRLRQEERRLDQLVAGDLRVAAAFRLSYEHLSPPARRAFRRLALVPGPDFGAPLAAAVDGATPAELEDALDELADLGLLEPVPGGRHRFHDLVRLFARERLAEEEPPAERAAAAARMEDWLLDVAVVAGRWFEPAFGALPAGWAGGVSLASMPEASAWLRVEADNWLAALRSAAAAGRPARVVEVAEAMHWFSDHWVHWGHWDEVFAMSSAAAGALGDPAEEARQLNYLSWARSMQGEWGEAVRLSLRAGELAAQAGDVAQQAWALIYAATAHWRLGETEEVARCATGAAALFRSIDDLEGYCQAVQYLADSDLALGRPAQALAGLRRLLALLDDPGSRISAHVADGARSTVTARLGSAYRALGRLPEAAEHLRRAIVLLRVERFGVVEARAEEELAGVLREQGDLEGAVAAYGRAADVHAALGDVTAAGRIRAEAAALRPARP